MEPHFRILGPLRAELAGRPLELGGPKPRRLLARLLIDAGHVVSVDRLIDAVWGDEPPAGAHATLRTHVANLRRGLSSPDGRELVVTRAPGYCLDIDPSAVDAGRFERLVEDGRATLAAGEPDRAAQTLRAALELWRGDVLDDLGSPPFCQAESARLEELRLVALEARVDADLALGRHGQLISELAALVDAHPYREHLLGRLMLALYRSGRQADALAAYRSFRERLDAELGLAPGHELSQLETAMLRHDPALMRPPPPSDADAAGTDRLAVPGDSAPRQPPGSSTPPASDALFDVVRRIPMVGRMHELEQLRGLWRSVRAGGRRAALLSGEAGVGKSRLVAELVGDAAGEGATVLVGRCEQAALIPYQPVVEALQRSPEAAAALAAAPARLRTDLAGLVDHPTAGEAPSDPDPHDPDPHDPDPDDPGLNGPEDRQAAVLDAVRRLLAGMATNAPVVFVIEEAECIDHASSRLLRHVARQLPGHTLLVVCFRDPPGSRHPPLRELLADLEGRGVADRLALSPLTEDELASLVATWTGSDAPGDVVTALWHSTGGNPFFANEVVRELAPRGGVSRADAAGHVPHSVRDVLRERLRSLTPGAREVIACAAVLGRRFDVSRLAQVTDRPDEVIAALDEAADAGWLVETGHAWEDSYAFRHVLMRQAVHSDLPARERQRLHLRAADALEADGLQRTADVAAAAAHLRAAGRLADRERTAKLSLEAAEAAADVYAWDEAVGHAEAAVAILDHAGASADQRGDAALRAAELLRRSSIDYRRAVELLESALSHFHTAGDESAVATVRARLGRVLSTHHSALDIPRALEHFAAAEPVLTDGEAAFEVHFGTALAALFALDTEHGCRAAERAAELAAQLGRQDLGALVNPTLASHRFNRGELASAHALITESWSTARELRDPHLGWEAVTMAVLADNVYLVDPVSSEAWCRAALALPRLNTVKHARQGLSDHLAYALAGMGELDAAADIAARLPSDAICQRQLLLLGGDWEAAARSWAGTLEHDLANGDRLNALLSAYWLSQVRRLLGDQEAATSLLRRAVSMSMDGVQVPAELMAKAELIRDLAWRGDTDEAGRHLARCEEILADGEDWRGQLANVELARGALAAATGRHRASDRAHDRAGEVFASHRAVWWQAESLLAWARWLAASGRHDRAEQQQLAAWALYEELDAPRRWRRAVV